MGHGDNLPTGFRLGLASNWLTPYISQSTTLSTLQCEESDRDEETNESMYVFTNFTSVRSCV